MGYRAPDVNRLLTSLQFKEQDRVPVMEFWITSEEVYEYVLGKKVKQIDAAEGGSIISPEDDVEFAERVGKDAVCVNFSYRPGNIFKEAEDGTRHYIDGRIKSFKDLKKMEKPPNLKTQLDRLERYLEVAEGTGIGIVPNFTSIFDSTLLSIGFQDFMYMLYDNIKLVEHIMDIILEVQVRAMKVVCEKYKDDIAWILYNDDIATGSGLMINRDMFKDLVIPRMKKLLAPAKKAGKIITTHTDGDLKEVIPFLLKLGVRGVHPVEPTYNDVYSLKKKWYGKIAFFGNIDVSLLTTGTKEEIKNEVKKHLDGLKEGGGYILGSSTSIFKGIPPENYLTMVNAAIEYGKYIKGKYAKNRVSN